jgi:hypothetical protein
MAMRMPAPLSVTRFAHLEVRDIEIINISLAD